MEEFVTPKQIAETFGVTLGTAYYWINVKRYFDIRLVGSRYLIPKAQVDAFRKNSSRKRMTARSFRHKARSADKQVVTRVQRMSAKKAAATRAAPEAQKAVPATA